MGTLVPGYHVAVVVDDLELSMTRLRDLVGLDWHPARPGGSSHHLFDGELVAGAPRLTFSRQGPPYVELVERRPGTVWAESGLHHIGFWVDDVRAESDRLAAGGAYLEAAGASADGERTSFCYHRGPDGLRIELVDIGHAGPGLTRYLSTPVGQPPAPASREPRKGSHPMSEHPNERPGLDEWLRRTLQSLPPLSAEQVSTISRVVTEIDRARTRRGAQGRRSADSGESTDEAVQADAAETTGAEAEVVAADDGPGQPVTAGAHTWVYDELDAEIAMLRVAQAAGDERLIAWHRGVLDGYARAAAAAGLAGRAELTGYVASKLLDTD